ncbi:MAG TPA: antitoxin [Mycobacteriales bacterium]|nr:antitoxin [Mycobacteriales bacterium]
MGIKDLVEKGRELVEDPVDALKSGIDKAEELADKATGGKISDKIIAAGDQVEKLLPGDEGPSGS